MQYSLLIYQTESQFADRTNPARRDAANGAFGNYVTTLKDAGVLLITLGVEPRETVATVRSIRGVPTAEIGVYADMKCQLGGVCVIEAPNREAAVAWAERAPFEHCEVVEVRPTRVVPVA